jgi:hypothetical protein
MSKRQCRGSGDEAASEYTGHDLIVGVTRQGDLVYLLATFLKEAGYTDTSAGTAGAGAIYEALGSLRSSLCKNAFRVDAGESLAMHQLLQQARSETGSAIDVLFQPQTLQDILCKIPRSPSGMYPSKALYQCFTSVCAPLDALCLLLRDGPCSYIDSSIPDSLHSVCAASSAFRSLIRIPQYETRMNLYLEEKLNRGW